MTLREIFNFILDFPIGYIFVGIIVLVLIGWLISKFEFAFWPGLMRCSWGPCGPWAPWGA